MSLSSAAEQSQCSEQREPDILNFERQLREVLHELQLKRVQVEESRQALNESTMARYELQRVLDSERMNAKETYAQLELALSTARRWEEDRVDLTQTASRLQVQLETAVRERDALREQFKSSQCENVKLKSTIEELEGQTRCQQACQDSCLSAQNKMSSSLKELTRQIQQLEQDQNRLETAVESVKKMFTPLKLNAQHIYHIQETEREKRSALEKKIFSLEAELGRLRNVNAKNYEFKGHDETKDYRREAQVMELESQLKAEMEANAQLQTALEEAFKAQSNLQRMEEIASSKLKCVTAELIMKQNFIAQIEAENRNLTKERQSLVEQLRDEKCALNELKEKSKPVETVHREIQVDTSTRVVTDSVKETDTVVETVLKDTESGESAVPLTSDGSAMQ